MKSIFNKHLWLPIFGTVILYFLFAYTLQRDQWMPLLGCYFGLFLLSYYIYQKCGDDIKSLTYLAFAFRAIFILAIPNLSQDFYRFLWDGQMMLEGLNPYLYTPQSFVNNGTLPFENALTLHEGMGQLSANNFTNYPPINQLCFALAALGTSKGILGGVVLLRMLIIGADFGILYFGKKLLAQLNLPQKHIFWYILNPFIIIELTGNLHFEGVMLFFLIWSLYLLYRGKWVWAAVVFALSVSTKLIPLLFLPLLYQWFIKAEGELPLKQRLAKLIGFYGIVGMVNLLLFLPFFSKTFITNYSQTVGLWFQNFEFNASLYYIARAIGYTFRGYNEIAVIGKFIPILTIITVMALAFFRKNKNFTSLITAMLLALTIYFFLSTTVHPWYIATLVLLCIFTSYRFPLVWSVVIILSYLAYRFSDTQENLWIIALEYLVVYAVFIWEIGFKKTNPSKVE